MPFVETVVDATYDVVNAFGNLEVAGVELYSLFDVGLIIGVGAAVFVGYKLIAKKLKL